MWRERKKLLSGVLAFLVACALLGFLMGVKGALPRGGAREAPPSGPPAAPSGEVVIEAAPVDEAIATPPVAEKADEDEPDEEEKAEKAKEPEKKAEPEPAPAPAPKIVVPPPAPKEEPPPADPVGDLLAPTPPPPDAVLY